jgi:hypothetical protein
MRTFPVWTNAERQITSERESGTLRVWGGGDTLEEASLAANEELERQIMLARDGQTPEASGSSDALREELVEYIDEDGVITRARDGALMLNTGRMAIFELRPKAAGALDQMLNWTSGVRKDPLQATKARALAWSRVHPDVPARLYQTVEGWRVILVDGPHDASDEQIAVWAEEIGADKAHLEDCRQRGFFRARISPEPSMVGMNNLDGWRHGAITETERTRIESWLYLYAESCADRRACAEPEALGLDMVHPSLQRALDAHDTNCEAFGIGGLA